MWRQSHSPVGLDLGGLGESDWDCPQHCGERLWLCLDLLLLLDQECCLHDPDCPIGESSLGCLATSLPHGSAEGEWVCEAEQPQECLLFLEGSADPSVPCRSALDICWFNSCCSSVIWSSCCQWKTMLGANVHYPWKTCSATCRMASSVAPMRLCMEECSGAVSLAVSACNLWECLQHSFFFMEATL